MRYKRVLERVSVSMRLMELERVACTLTIVCSGERYFRSPTVHTDRLPYQGVALRTIISSGKYLGFVWGELLEVTVMIYS